MEPNKATSKTGILCCTPPEWIDIHPLDGLQSYLGRASAALSIDADVAPFDQHGINMLLEHWDRTRSDARKLMADAKIPFETADSVLKEADDTFQSIWAAHADLSLCWERRLE